MRNGATAQDDVEGVLLNLELETVKKSITRAVKAIVEERGFCVVHVPVWFLLKRFNPQDDLVAHGDDGVRAWREVEVVLGESG